MVTYSSHIHGGILDLVVTNNPEEISNIIIDSSSQSLSDHYMIQFNILIKRIPQIKRCCSTFFNYHKPNFASMSDYLVSALYCVPISSDSNFIWDYIKTL